MSTDFDSWHNFLQQEYEAYRLQLSKNQYPLLDRAITQRYLDLRELSSRRASTIRHVYETYCTAYQVPLLLITRGQRAHLARVVLNLEPTEYEYGRLDMNDETFRLIMLLAHDYILSEGYICFRCVNVDNVEEVARQLLAFYDRSCGQQKRQEAMK